MTIATRLRLVASIPAWRPKSKDYGQNARLQHFAMAKRAKEAKKKTGDALMVAGWPHQLPPGRFTLTFRVEQAAGKLMDSDNQASVLKAPRDAIAKWLGVDDGPRGPIQWVYTACRGAEDRVLMVLEKVG